METNATNATETIIPFVYKLFFYNKKKGMSYSRHIIRDDIPRGLQKLQTFNRRSKHYREKRDQQE